MRQQPWERGSGGLLEYSSKRNRRRTSTSQVENNNIRTHAKPVNSCAYFSLTITFWFIGSPFYMVCFTKKSKEIKNMILMTGGHYICCSPPVSWSGKFSPERVGGRDTELYQNIEAEEQESEPPIQGLRNELPGREVTRKTIALLGMAVEDDI